MLFQEMSQAAGGQLFPSSPPPSTATRPTTCEHGDDPHRAATPLTRSRGPQGARLRLANDPFRDDRCRPYLSLDSVSQTTV